MGQYESKQRLPMISSSLAKMRRDLKDGKIRDTATIERCRGVLLNHSKQLEVIGRRIKSSEVDKLELQIDKTLRELDAIGFKEEDLDAGAVSTNSFRRTSSKNSSKGKNKAVLEITEGVEQIRKMIDSGEIKEQDYDHLQRRLVDFSQRLSYFLKSQKKHEVTDAQRLVSSTIEQLFNMQKRNSEVRSDVDSTTPPVQEEQTQTPAKSKLSKITNNKAGSLDDIENKLSTLKGDIKVAESNKDKSRLHFLGKSVQTLLTDLQMMDVDNQIVNEERKVLLEKALMRAHHRIDKIKKDLSAETDAQYTLEQQKKEKKEKSLQDLDDIENTILAISRNLNQQNFQAEKQSFNDYKNKLNAIEDIDQEVTLKKSAVFDAVLNVENIFTRLEMEDRINQAEWKHCQYRVDLDNFKETTESEEYKKQRQYLLQLKELVTSILEVSQKVDEKKKYILYNIDNNLATLEKKAKENEAKSKDENDDVILRKKRTVTNQNLMDNLLGCYKEFEKYFSGNCGLDELKTVLLQLSNLNKLIDERMRVLEYQIITDDPNIELVTVKADYVDYPISSVPPPKGQLDNIRQEVETLQANIENSRYTKDHQFYKDMKDKLESYKSEVYNLTQDNEHAQEIGGTVLRTIDDTFMLLENNRASRKSTTEDILIDIMSISTRVNDLGSKIQGFNNTSQDYDSIRSGLLEHQSYLKNLQIGPSRTNLYKTRDEVLQQIRRYLTELENLKKNERFNTVSEEEKKFRQELRKLKDKVSRYSGTYKNVLYKSIEGDLHRCLKTVDRVFNDNNVASKVKRDIENNLMILEQKSSKDQKYDNIKKDVDDSGTNELTVITDNIESVKKELTKVKRFTKEELDKLDAKLNLSILALDNIKDEHLNNEKSKLYQDINLYFRRIQELKMVKPVISEDVVVNQFNKQQAAAETIAKVERKLEAIKPEILTFIGLETSSKFFELDEALIGSTLKLDALKLDKNGELHQMKVRLLREIQKYSDILDGRVNQTEEMENLEKEVKEMLMKIDSFNGYFGDPEYSILDEQIIRLKVNLGKMQANQELQARKEACIKEVDYCLKKLNDDARMRDDGLGGTLV